MARICFYCGVAEDASDDEKVARLLTFEVDHLFVTFDHEALQRYKDRWGEDTQHLEDHDTP